MKQLTALLATALASALTAQSHIVAPSHLAAAEGTAYGWIAGASRPVRQQILVGGSHLSAAIGQPLLAIEFRRDGAAEGYGGGSADLTVTLSTTAAAPNEASPTFQTNVGANAVQVFSGTITLPTSPAPSGAPSWNAQDTIRIPFTTPFVYVGGTLCVDITGTPIAGQHADWWMADQAFEDLPGAVVDLGGGCGIYGGSSAKWGSVEKRSLVAGSTATFRALGTPNGLAIAAFGAESPLPIPLSATGLPGAPGCDLWLNQIDILMPTIFWPPPDAADVVFGGEAAVAFVVPNTPAVFGVSMTTQWLDWSQMATSNALTWTIANATPTLDMALVEGDAAEPTGFCAPYMAHVLRLEHQ